MPVARRNSPGGGGQYRTVGGDGASGASDDVVIGASLEAPHGFGVIFDRHAAVVHRYLTSRVGTAADDLLSEVFVAAFRSRRNYDHHYDNAVPWLLGIATNVVRHHHRSEGRRSALLRRIDDQTRARTDQVLDDVATEVLERSEMEEVRSAVGAIDERYRDVLILYSAFGLSYAEIADALGLRIGTVRSRLSRGRAQLRELLADSGQYVGDEDRSGARSNEVEGTSS